MLIFDACSPTQLIKDVLASCKYCCQRNVPEASCAVSRWLVQFRQLVGLLSALSAYVWVSVMSMNFITYRYIEWRVCVDPCCPCSFVVLLPEVQKGPILKNWTGFNAHNPTFLRSLCPLVIWSNVTISICRTYCHIPTLPFTSVASTVI